MSKTFTLTRKKAADLIGVSTRTIDRYVKSGKLSYRKIANKVLLSPMEIKKLQKDFQTLHENTQVDIVRTVNSHTSLHKQGNVDQLIDKKMDTFYKLITDKDKVIEDKNKLIFMLQQRIGEVETKLQSMIALPDYSKEKQTMMLEKQRLESKILQLQEGLKREKNKSFLFLGVVMVIILMYFIITKLS